VRWTEDGWPIVGERGVVELVLPRPTLPAEPPAEAAMRDDFDAAALGPEWAFVRRPLDAEVLHARPGWLTLTPQAGLESPFPCFVGRRQQHYEFRAEARLVLDARRDGDEAGLTVRMNEFHQHAVCLRRQDGETSFVVRTRVGRMDVTSVLGAVETFDVVLGVEGDADSYVFTARDGSGNVLRSAPVEAKFLSAEVAGGFTGVFVGMYAATSHPGSGFTAAFDWFDYAPTARVASDEGAYAPTGSQSVSPAVSGT
jgi:alpha-N-arabinofuranosidase